MLILHRKKNESIIVNDNIQLSVLEIGNDYVKLAIEAPKDIPILRSELVEAAGANREACSADLSSLSKLKDFYKIRKGKE